MTVKKVLGNKDRQKVKSIYMAAFPKEERMPFGMMTAMSCLWNTEFLAFYDEDALCGMVYLANIGRQTFIMFLAVDETLRNKGYGGQILDEIQERHPKNKIIVSIEPCDDIQDSTNIRVRRKNFYMRKGYDDTGYYMKLGGAKQEVLVKNGQFSKSKFVLFFVLYSNCTVIPKIWLKQTEQVS